MAKADTALKELKDQKKDIQSALGLGIEVDCFLDGSPRTAYPVTLKEYPTFIESIMAINPDNMAQCFFYDQGEGLKQAIALTFNPEMVDEILENVNATNFKEFVMILFDINGLKLDSQGGDSKKK